MATVHSPQEYLNPLVLRSHTPAPGEKVLKYLASMSQEGPDCEPPRSVIDSAEYRSNQSAVRSPPLSSRSLQQGNGALFVHDDDDGHGEDVDSNIQEGRSSEIGHTVPGREPGPHDPPGPKYESYDSGPSFGNFGPLPVDDPPASNNHYGLSSWTPKWGDMEASGVASPNNAAKIPLPPSEFAFSPRAPSLGIDLQNIKPRSQTGVAASPKPAENLMSPKSVARTESNEDRLLSPKSTRSKATNKTRATDKGTVYPPLPESRNGDWETNFDIGSPRSRAFSKAPSISPSDSPSNIKPKPTSRSPVVPSVVSHQSRQLSNSDSNVKPRSAPRSPVVPSVASHQSRPFSPYRVAPTTADLIHAAARNRSLVIPEEDEKTASLLSKSPSVAPSQVSKAPSQSVSKVHSESPSKAPSQSPSKVPSQAPSKVPSQASSKVPSQAPSKAPSQVSSRAPSQVPSKARSQSTAKQPSVVSFQQERADEHDRAPSPDGLDPEEARIVADALGGLTPRTSCYTEQPLEPDATDHYHDTELCVLLHQEADEGLHELVRKALRKAIRQRVKRLGMKYDADSIKQFTKSFHDHDQALQLLNSQFNDEPPRWAVDLKRDIVLMQQRLESISENLKPQDRSFQGSRFAYEGDEYTRTPMTQTVNIQTQHTGTLGDSMYHNPEEEVPDDNVTESQRPLQADDTSQFHGYGLESFGRDDSPGSLVLEKELYKLRQKPASQSGRTHHTWEVTRDEGGEFDDDEGPHSGLPTIPDTNGDAYADRDRSQSPPLPPLPVDEEHDADESFAASQRTQTHEGNDEQNQVQLLPWQRIHSRLLSWATIWPTSELDQALNSTTRGNQVDEIALSIWVAQTYKRYVRARLTEGPSGVDRLFVPPNLADTINNAVFNGRHEEACGILKDLWTPFGLNGMPRLILVLAKHRSDPNHWVVHRFSLPDGKLSTYDTFQDRTLPDGRPLGWWFAIRIAWRNAPFPSPESLVQKMIRLHRPMQLGIDNSVAAAGIWRNLLMGSRAERSLDLERLRDLINTEVKNLRQRRLLGKLWIAGPKPGWEHLGA